MKLLTGAILFIISYIGIEIFRRWSLRRNILDLPNERSSHTIPTPRGGGLIIVLIVLIYFAHITQDLSLLPYFIGAILIAIISWLDDIKPISSGIRFAVHSISAAIAIYGFGYFQENLGFQIGYIGIFITFFWILWLTNAYNFMDGIDGIAGIQAITASIGWLLITYLNSSIINELALAILCSTLAFLCHNWSPAKIFMGDVGSAFLGYTFAVIPLIILQKFPDHNHNNLFFASLVFVWFFVFDTVFTFCRRLLNGEKVWQAHRSHLYQRLVISGFSHQFVTLFYGLLSFLLIFFYYLLVNNNYLLMIGLLVISGLFLFIFTTYNEKRITEKNQ